MTSRQVTFFGDLQGQFGIPTPFHRYLLVASEWRLPGSAVASILAITDAPEPNQRHVLVQRGGIGAALDAAESVLDAIPANKGLQKNVG